jgi:hypothetical protein
MTDFGVFQRNFAASSVHFAEGCLTKILQPFFISLLVATCSANLSVFSVGQINESAEENKLCHISLHGSVPLVQKFYSELRSQTCSVVYFENANGLARSAISLYD